MKHLSIPFVLALTLTLLVGLCSCSSRVDEHHRKKIFNVLHYGAVGDGHTDDSKVFLNTFKAACSYKNGSRVPTMRVPRHRTYLLHPVVFNGPCKSNSLELRIMGKLIAPSDPKEWRCDGGEKKCRQWIGFAHQNGLHISGNGSLDGKGPQWWQKYCSNQHKQCQERPKSLTIGHSNNVRLSGLTFIDSPQMHIAIERSTFVRINYLTIVAPGDSPNTDGIHTQHATDVSITHSHISTGDDCISMGDGTADVRIKSIKCGPGHGISVGSLGIKGQTEKVENVHVSDVEFTNTTNGVRIKTWQGGNGYAKNIIFENIRTHNSRRPIIIDQSYCDHTQCTTHKSAVKISNVTYSNIVGTSKDKTAVILNCSKSIPCKNIIMNDIDIRLQSNRANAVTESSCQNVVGKQHGEVFPRITCLSRR